MPQEGAPVLRDDQQALPGALEPQELREAVPIPRVQKAQEHLVVDIPLDWAYLTASLRH